MNRKSIWIADDSSVPSAVFVILDGLLFNTVSVVVAVVVAVSVVVSVVLDDIFCRSFLEVSAIYIGRVIRKLKL